MDFIVNKNLANFEFSTRARKNAAKLTQDELKQLDGILQNLNDRFRPFRKEEIDNIFWGDFDWVCELLGYRYDSKNDVIIRNVKKD